MRGKLFGPIIAAFAVVGAVACSDGTTAGVGLAFSTRNNPTAPLSGAQSAAVVQQGDSTIVVLGNDTVIIRSVEVVLREVELERIDIPDCPDLSGSDNDGCEKFTAGISLVTLPLGNATEKMITVNVPAGIYDEVEFEVHKPDDTSDAAFIAANPAFADVSIRVTGTYSQAGTRTDFVYTTDLNKDQEVALNPPLDVTADGPVNLTIRIDVGTWFLNAGGTALVDPATANKGGANENIVKTNIEQSIDAFHDDDSDGLDDDGEDDDHGSSHDSP